MRKWKLSLMLFFVMLLGSTALAQIKRHWRLDETTGLTATDNVGKADGILERTPLPVWQPSEGIGGAIEIHATDRIATPSLDIGSSFTVMGWCKTTTTSQGNWPRFITSYYADGFFVGLQATNNRWSCIVNGTAALVGPTMYVNQWQHIALVYNGTTQQEILYVDGVGYGPASATPPRKPNQAIAIGSDFVLNNPSITGLYDDIAVYDTVLSASEIQAIFIDGLSGHAIDWWQASNPTPVDGADDQPLDITLSWSAGSDPPSPIINHVLYYGKNAENVNASNEPNLFGDTARLVLPAGTTEYLVSFSNDTTIYWRVDEQISSTQIAKGDIWEFSTLKLLAQIIQQPQNQRAFEGQGESVTFTVTATSDTTMNYQWYKDGGPIGTNSDQLTINNVVAADAGEYYVEITNDAGVRTSDSAFLILKELIGHWPLDGDPNDASGYGNDGVVKGAANDPGYVAGFIGTGAAEFNASENDHIQIPNPTHFDYYDELTVSYWMNANILNNSQATSATPISKGGNHGGWCLSRFYWTDLISVHIDANPDTLNNDTYVYWTKEPSVFDSAWHFVTLVVDHNIVYIYVDGELRQTDSSPDMVPSDFTIYLGAWIGKKASGTWYGDFFYNGLLDDVRIYNYALPATDIAQLYYDATGLPACMTKPAGDADDDCDTDIEDLALLASGWLDCGLFPVCP